MANNSGGGDGGAGGGGGPPYGPGPGAPPQQQWPQPQQPQQQWPQQQQQPQQQWPQQQQQPQQQWPQQQAAPQQQQWQQQQPQPQPQWSQQQQPQQQWPQQQAAAQPPQQQWPQQQQQQQGYPQQQQQGYPQQQQQPQQQWPQQQQQQWQPPPAGQPQPPYGQAPQPNAYAPPPAQDAYGARPGAPPPPAPTGPVEPIPWEQRAQIGFISALFKTIEKMMKPQAFFDSVAVGDDPAHAVRFGITCWVIGASARAVFGFLFGGLLGIGFFGGSFGVIGNLSWLVFNLLVAAVLGFVAVTVFGTIEHGMLENQKAATRPKGATMKVVGYSGVAGLLFFIPGYVGNFVWLLTVVLNVIGLQRVHRCDQNKAVVSALVAGFVTAFIYVAIFGAIATVVFASLFL